MVHNSQAKLAVVLGVSVGCTRRVVVHAEPKDSYVEVHLPADSSSPVGVACDVRIFDHGVLVVYTVHNALNSTVWVMEAPYVLNVDESASSVALAASDHLPRAREVELPIRWQAIPPSGTRRLEKQGTIGDTHDYSWSSNMSQDVVCAVPYWIGDVAPTAGPADIARSSSVTLTISRPREPE